jgi:putative cell wall-binding protein/uncharacterized protein YkwD
MGPIGSWLVTPGGCYGLRAFIPATGVPDPVTRPAARRAVGVLASVALFISLAAPVAAVDGDTYVRLTNEVRKEHQKPPVSLSAPVDRIAVERANQMASGDDFSHDLSYVASRLKALGVCYSTYGEIIAWESGYPSYDPARTIRQWVKSPGHFAIMTGDYTVAGGSHAKSAASGKTYSAMIFVKGCSSSTSAGVTIKRLAGSDRYATAAAISRARFGSGASTVFIATGASFPDALAGSPAAARARGPILLTGRGSLPSATRSELDRLNPSKIVVLGGTGTVSGTVAGQLASYAPTIVRWAGADRYATAAAISRSTFAPGVRIAYVATGTTFPDALSGGALAGRGGAPILLTERGSLPGATAAELGRLKPSAIVILGGSGAVSDAVASALRRYATSGSVTRLAGSDRYATSVRVSRAGFGSAGSDDVFVATGTNFPDGLAGGPVAALVPGPLLLVAPTSLPGSVATELDRLDPSRVFVLGGTGSVSDAVLRSIDATLP